MGKAETASREKKWAFLAPRSGTIYGPPGRDHERLRIAVKRLGRTSGSLFPALLLTFVCMACGQAAFAQAAARYRFHDGVALNDLKGTPGAVRTTDKSQICDQPAGWTDQFRNTTEALKEEVFAEYGVDKHGFNRAVFCTGSVVCDTDEEWAKKNKGHKTKLPMYEIDHVDSLELAGADVKENLMPQPYYAHPGAHEKDAVENWLHKQVCAGKMELKDAQQKVAQDWYAVYLEAGLHRLKPVPPSADAPHWAARWDCWQWTRKGWHAEPTALGLAFYRIGLTRLLGVRCEKAPASGVTDDGLKPGRYRTKKDGGLKRPPLQKPDEEPDGGIKPPLQKPDEEPDGGVKAATVEKPGISAEGTESAEDAERTRTCACEEICEDRECGLGECNKKRGRESSER